MANSHFMLYHFFNYISKWQQANLPTGVADRYSAKCLYQCSIAGRSGKCRPELILQSGPGLCLKRQMILEIWKYRLLQTEQNKPKGVGGTCCYQATESTRVLTTSISTGRLGNLHTGWENRHSCGWKRSITVVFSQKINRTFTSQDGRVDVQCSTCVGGDLFPCKLLPACVFLPVDEASHWMIGWRGSLFMTTAKHSLHNSN